ncbi:MAG: glycine cleavage system H protein [Mariniblastus sp.]|jgi:glycine cleavage system H protein
MIDESSSDSSLIFMMGEFEAVFPTDRLYAKNHMWAQPVAGGETDQFRFGFTAYAVRLLQDVYFLDWLIDAPSVLKTNQEIGSIESKKAESALFAPAAGELTQFNESLMEDPSAINTDKYGEGWLLDVKIQQPEFLTPEQYIELLDEVWAKTQRTIKGQLNE